MEIQLKELRKRAGISQDEMANRLGIKTSRYGTWERGDRMISLEQAYNCALILGCTIDEIAGYECAGRAREFPDPYQAELNDCYEASTAEGRSVILGTARGQRELSLKTAERREPEADRPVRKAM